MIRAYFAAGHNNTIQSSALVGANKVAFENVELDTDDLQNARDWCEQIIIARFMELMTTAHKIAKSKKLNWGAVPIYFTEHSYDFTLKSDK